jgi:glycosyltransferase involved in cell wall biosynthesis
MAKDKTRMSAASPSSACILPEKGPVTVAHCIASNFYGGPERQVLTHLEHLQRSGVRPLLIPFFEEGRRNELYLHAQERGIPVAPLRRQGAFNPLLIGELAGVLHREQVHLLVTHGYKANVVGRLASWFMRVPEVAVSRGWTGECPRVRLYERLDRLFLRFARHVVAVSAGQRAKVVEAGVPAARVSVIHNAIDLETYPPSAGVLRPLLGIPDTAEVVITAGRLSPEKNHAGMIRAAAMVLERHPDVYFAVFGEGALRSRLERQIEEAGLQNRFFLPGFRKDMRGIMHECDIFVLPSFTEGLPNVALEAAACRRPVVCTRAGGSPEVVRHGHTGLVTEPGDDAALAAAVGSLLDDPALRRTMGENAYSFISRSFSYAGQTEQYLNLYRRITPMPCAVTPQHCAWSDGRGGAVSGKEQQQPVRRQEDA